MPHELPDDLLADLSGSERDEREALLRWLLSRGFSPEELREAADSGRLPFLPSEIVFKGGGKYSLEEAAKAAGLNRDFVVEAWRAAGIPIPEGDEAVVSDEDLQALRMARQVLDAGISEEAYIEISRIVGRGAAPAAEAVIENTVEQFLAETEGETKLAMRLSEAAEQITPLLPVLLAFPVRMHLRSSLRRYAIEQGPKAAELAESRHMAIAFADLVGFTELSERSERVASGLAAELEAVASSVVDPPVRLVKLIGDAVMLASDETLPLVRAVFRLRAAAAETEDLPELRIGVAAGEVVTRAGDVFGPSVNLASRLAGAAEPGEVLAPAQIVDELDESVSSNRAPSVELKGIGRVEPLTLAPA